MRLLQPLQTLRPKRLQGLQHMQALLLHMCRVIPHMQRQVKTIIWRGTGLKVRAWQPELSGGLPGNYPCRQSGGFYPAFTHVCFS
jgi:hypothetical protein